MSLSVGWISVGLITYLGILGYFVNKLVQREEGGTLLGCRIGSTSLHLVVLFDRLIV